MTTNTLVLAKPPSNNISLEDCDFYTVQDIPGLSKPTEGEWDLRKGVDEYLGHVYFKNKTVLELGPASGYLTFHIEKTGGDVTSIELSVDNDKWDVVPACNQNWQADEKEHMKNDLAKVQNAFWYAHKAFNSNSKVVHSHVYNLPQDIGTYDISLMSSVLLHLQNPFLAIQNMLSHTKEKAIITDVLPGGSRSTTSLRNVIRNLLRRDTFSNMPRVPYLQFLPKLDNPHNFAWWLISPEAIVNMASLFGFEKSSINYHVQLQNGTPVHLYTVVCERTIPIDNCNYSHNFTEPPPPI